MSLDLFEHFKVGHAEEFSHIVSEKDVDSFVELTGDDNPLHMSDEFAQSCLFGKRVVHGMLTSSFISTMIGRRIPGPGALWQSQTLYFRNPTYIGDQILIKAELLQKSIGQRTFRIKTEITNQSGKLLVDGEAVVKVLKPAEKEKKKMVKEKGAVIVTGGSGGIGGAICKRLAKDGFLVVLNYNDSPDSANHILEEIKAQNGEGFVYKADITDKNSISELVQVTLNTYGQIDGVVNNAGPKIVNQSIDDLSWEDCMLQLEVHLKGPLELVKLVTPHFRERKYGKIINITSAYTDNVPPVKMYSYTIAKSALSALTRSLAVELGPLGISVNNVSPGMTETALLQGIPEKSKLVTEMQTPLRRLGRVEDVANAVAFLMDPETDYVTGETLRVSGGQHMI